jgi:hypothetical protein
MYVEYIVVGWICLERLGMFRRMVLRLQLLVRLVCDHLAGVILTWYGTPS